MDKNKELDSQEHHIVKQLIKNPRISDNKISRLTGIPLRTVNRKRKALEAQNLISYFTYLHSFTDGLCHFNARNLVTLKFRLGITRKMLVDSIDAGSDSAAFNSKHVLESHIGESNGHLMLVMIIESMSHADIIEIINAEIVPGFQQTFGKDVIIDTSVIELSVMLRMLHNYMPGRNMKNGKIKDGWDDTLIYVTE